MRLKEGSVKSDVERMWTEWQAKLEFAENELSQSESRVSALEAEKKQLNKTLLELRKESRESKTQTSELNSQLALVQEKYEDIISVRDSELKQAQQDKATMEDSLQKEIEFFKKEVARLAKVEEVQK